jgi:hypothetical protein
MCWFATQNSSLKFAQNFQMHSVQCTHTVVLKRVDKQSIHIMLFYLFPSINVYFRLYLLVYILEMGFVTTPSYLWIYSLLDIVSLFCNPHIPTLLGNSLDLRHYGWWVRQEKVNTACLNIGYYPSFRVEKKKENIHLTIVKAANLERVNVFTTAFVVVVNCYFI